MTPSNNAAPPFSQESYDLSFKAEVRFHEYLHRIGLDHVWVNEHGESHCKGDFIIMGRLVDVEYKDYKKYQSLIETEGLQFLSRKVDSYPPNSIYVMDIEQGFFHAPMQYILDHKVDKDRDNVARMGRQLFYAVPLHLLEYTPYS
jgi:hypothetical protein